MVAIVGEDGHVTRVMKRSANEWKLMRARKLLNKFHEKSAALVKFIQMICKAGTISFQDFFHFHTKPL